MSSHFGNFPLIPRYLTTNLDCPRSIVSAEEAVKAKPLLNNNLPLPLTEGMELVFPHPCRK